MQKVRLIQLLQEITSRSSTKEFLYSLEKQLRSKGYLTPKQKQVILKMLQEIL